MLGWAVHTQDIGMASHKAYSLVYVFAIVGKTKGKCLNAERRDTGKVNILILALLRARKMFILKSLMPQRIVLKKGFFPPLIKMAS